MPPTSTRSTSGSFTAEDRDMLINMSKNMELLMPELARSRKEVINLTRINNDLRKHIINLT